MFFAQKSQNYVISMLKSIHWTPRIFLTSMKDSLGGALDTEKSKQTLEMMISLLLIHPQGAHGGLQIRKKIINKYNNSNQESKMSCNLWSLRRKIKEDCLQSLRKWEINNCNICLLDNWRNYEKYMSKWLCFDVIHSMKDYTTSVLMFLLFFYCIQKKSFIFLVCSPTQPNPNPRPYPTLLFQIKNCKPFPNLSMNWHFCLHSSQKNNNKKRTTSKPQFWGSRTSPPWRILGPCLYVILHRLFSYTVLLPIKASGHWKKQPWP